MATTAEKVAECEAELKELKRERASATNESRKDTIDGRIKASTELLTALIVIAREGACLSLIISVSSIFPNLFDPAPMSAIASPPTDVSVPADRAGRRVEFQHFREACMRVCSM